MQYTPNPAQKIALATIFATLVFIVTSQIPPIPIPATSGYFNVGETTIYIAALLFGPLVGALSGGIGAALSDIYLGYAPFAPGTLLIKGIEGAIVGYLNIKLKKHIKNTTTRAIIAITIGGLEMVAGYFLYERFIIGLSLSVALAEVPINLGQMLIGLIIAIPIMHAVMRFFPQLKNQQ
ncbi:MAG: ECF transporter S component [Candidatus Bathyarchaeota archaeon]|nr:ECF transporter S component [Candidatus Bathyarchaeota archaeon]